MKKIAQTESNKYYLQKAAWCSIFLILIWMVHSLFQFKYEKEEPNPITFTLDKNWTVTSLDSTQLPDADDHSSILKSARNLLASGNYQKTELPYTGKTGDRDILLFHNTLPEEYAGMLLQFSSFDVKVRISLDGKIIYQHEPLNADMSENYEHFVEIPYIFQNGELWIEMTSPYPEAAVLSEISVKMRNAAITVIGYNTTDIISCLLIILMAVIMFVLALIRRYTSQPGCGEVPLGLAWLAGGIYCFIGTDTLFIFYNIPQVYEMQEYLVLLIPVLLTLYFDQTLHTLYPRRFSTLLCIVILYGILQALLQKQGIWNFKEKTYLPAYVTAAVCAIAIISLLQLNHKNKQHQALLSMLSMLILLSGIIINIADQLFHDYMANIMEHHSMAISAILMTVVHILQLTREYRASAEDHARLLNEKIKAAEQQNIQLALAKKDADAARHEALAANEAKGKFLAHMSHEIRTPINAVLGMDEMILRESKEPQIKEYAMDIYTAGQTLLSLINDILDFSKIESGKMEIVPVEYDISSLIHDLTNMASQRAEAKNIRLVVEADHDIPSRLYGDDVRIRQVLTNILTNAVKYTHEGTVWLRIQNHTQNDTAVLYFEVEDTGIGIKEEDLPKLTAEFERIEEDRNRNIEGTGLGMNITIQILELLGSRLQVESSYGKGSRFYFELEQKIIDDTPIGNLESRVQQMAEHYSHAAKFCAPQAQILVVDDNAVNRKVLRNLLKNTQIQITDACGGAECLELVQKNHYDLIFLDHMMPDMDGMETLHRIKSLADFPCRDTPIVVLTANAVSGAKEHYLAEGFDAFLSKPVIPEKLETLIIDLLPENLLSTTEDNPAPCSGTSAADLKTTDFLDTLPQVDGLDWQYAWLHLPEEELLAYTVKEFYAQIDSAANRLEQEFGQIQEPEHLELYRIQVHAMKSLAASVGIIPLAGMAKILEDGARENNIKLILSITPPFLKEWHSYREKLQGVFDIGITAKQEVSDPSVIQALLEMVRISMQELDIDQADQYMGQLLAYEYPQEQNQTIQKLADAVTNLDPEETDRLTKLLINNI